MRTASTLVSAALVASVSAHTRIYGAWVNGEDQGDGRETYIRSPPTNDPVKDTTSADLVCNVAGATPASGFVSAAAGDTIQLEWYHDSRGDDIIASSHKGPLITWIAPYFEDAGDAAIWTKIAESGYDGSTWATDTLIANGGKQEFTIPDNLAAGQYVIRQEIIALHEADACYATAGSRGAQFYPSCVQFEITGSGTAVPDQAFDFNAEYDCDDEGIVFNVYGTFTEYPIPGPEVSTLDGSSSSSGSSDSSASTPTTTAASGSAAATGASKDAATTLSTSTTTSSAAQATETDASCSKRRKARRDALRAAARRA